MANNTVQNTDIKTLSGGTLASKPKEKLDYVTGAQGRLYFGGILIDECYDLQYTYHETKEPIYGYNSKNFDHILKGQVIIYGSFTINYKHDKYLWAVLSKLRMGETIQESKDRKINLKDLENSYKAKLEAYKGNRNDLVSAEKKLKDLTSYQNEIDANILTEKASINATANDHLVKVNEVLQNRDMFLSGLPDDTAKTLLKNKSDFDTSIDDPTYSQGGGLAQDQKDFMDSINQLNDEIAINNNIISSLNNELSDTLNLLVNAPSLQEKVYSLQQEIQSKQALVDSLTLQKDSLPKLFSSSIKQREATMKDTLDLNPNLKKLVTFDTTLARAVADKNAFITSKNKTLDLLLNEKTLNQEKINAQIALKGDLTKKKTSLLAEITKLKEDEVKKGLELATYLEQNLISLLGGPTQNIDTKEQRAEDFYGGFNIFIEFNGNVHKTIEGCELTGHCMALTVAGSPVKEQYNFIGRKIL